MDWRKLVIISCLPLCLSGCVAAAIVAGIGAGAAGTTLLTDKRGAHQEFNDRKITDTIKSKIVHNPWLRRNSHIVVATYNATVLLAGQAQSQQVKDFAGNLAKSTPHVKKVFNELDISGTQGTLTTMNDSWLETKVKSEMVARKGLNTNAIKVVAVGGNVYLMGKVSQQQAQLAANTVRRIGGVRRVVEVFETEQ